VPHDRLGFWVSSARNQDASDVDKWADTGELVFVVDKRIESAAAGWANNYSYGQWFSLLKGTGSAPDLRRISG
jgi:hypothetical protein